jgi:hypothetical protein
MRHAREDDLDRIEPSRTTTKTEPRALVTAVRRALA